MELVEAHPSARELELASRLSSLVFSPLIIVLPPTSVVECITSVTSFWVAAGRGKTKRSERKEFQPVAGGGGGGGGGGGRSDAGVEKWWNREVAF